MNEEQSEVVNSALAGHSFIITGQCGTGKTYLLRSLIKELRKGKKEVAVTSTTGIASLQLDQCATTIHHWSGILDGRYTKEELRILFQNDDRFQSAKVRISKADVLLIDEIGMLSKTVFEAVEFVCRLVYQKDSVFGDLQVIVSGDFKQLPPIANRRYQDNGDYCFTSRIFMQAFPHHINLTQVMRQTEHDLVNAVNELCNGTPSLNTVHLMKRLNRPLHSPVNLIKIFGTNFDVDYVNHEMLDQMDGDEVMYMSKDQGNLKLLRSSPASKRLLLKVGAPVIIIRNIEGRIFNGTCGIIHRLSEDEVVVTINNININIPCINFEIHDQQKKKTLACRFQYPIKLAFALTVHRAQGQTIPYLEVDCLSFFAPGQIGVAVGRAVSKLGLKIVNYNDSVARLKHPQEVYNFYCEKFQSFSLDLSCCNDRTISEDEPSITPYQSACEKVQPHQEEDQFSNIEKKTCPWDVDEFISTYSDTTYINCIPDNKGLLMEHVELLYSVVWSVCANENKKNWTAVLKTINSFLVSDTHIKMCENVFNLKHISKEQNKLSTKLCMWLLEKEVSKQSDKIVSAQNENVVQNAACSQVEYTDASKAKIRYIAGACVSKISTRLRQSVMRSFQIKRPSQDIKATRMFNYLKQNLLKQLEIKECEIEEDEKKLVLRLTLNRVILEVCDM